MHVAGHRDQLAALAQLAAQQQALAGEHPGTLQVLPVGGPGGAVGGAGGPPRAVVVDQGDDGDHHHHANPAVQVGVIHGYARGFSAALCAAWALRLSGIASGRRLMLPAFRGRTSAGPGPQELPALLAFPPLSRPGRTPCTSPFSFTNRSISPGSSNRIEFRWVSRSLSRVVHCWPVALTYCRSSWQMAQTAGRSSASACCVPQVVQMKFVMFS